MASLMSFIRKRVRVLPVALRWTTSLELSDRIKVLKIPWKFLEKELSDRGAYLLVLRLSEPRKVEVGRLGRLTFRRGFYIYVGSAMARLTQRIERHRRRSRQVSLPAPPFGS